VDDRANKLARELADTLDDMATLKTEFAEYVERTTRRLASFELANGADPDEVELKLWDDADKITQRIKDRAWNEGYIEGMYASEVKIRDFRISEINEIAAGRDG